MVDDLIVLDRDDQPIMLVEVRPTRKERGTIGLFLNDLNEYAQTARTDSVAFAMLVDPAEICLFHRGEPDGAFQHIVTFDATEVFRHYSDDYDGEATPHGTRRVFKIYLTGLVEAWVSDLDFHWKAGEPPKRADLLKLGLLERIVGGSTVNRETMHGAALY